MKRRRLVLIGALVVVLVGGGLLGARYVRDRLRGPEPHHWPTTDLKADDVVEYKQGAKRPLHLHLFKPAGAPTGTIIFFHGGGLRNTPLDQFLRQAQHLSDEGMLAVIAEYQVEYDDATFTTASGDAGDAIAWLRTHAGELSIDPTKIAASGASAGGGLAASTELTKGDSHPDALVLFNPAVNANDANTGGGVPTLVMHGDNDHTVPLASAKGFCDALKRCEMLIWPGGDHGFFNDGDAFTATLARADEFLRTLGYLPPHG